jgi:NAD(P)H-hydrate epimerase
MTKNPDSIPQHLACGCAAAAERGGGQPGLTLFELMQRAGEAAFQLARAYPASAHWLILCGHGNNGGDGYVVRVWRRPRGGG